MSVLTDRVAAAIDRLEEFLDDTGHDGWEVQLPAAKPYYTGNPRVWRLASLFNENGPREGESEVVPVQPLLVSEDRSSFVAEMVVALQRTVTVQIDLLNGELQRIERTYVFDDRTRRLLPDGLVWDKYGDELSDGDLFLLEHPEIEQQMHPEPRAEILALAEAILGGPDEQR